MLVIDNRIGIHSKINKIFGETIGNGFEISKNKYGKPYLKDNVLYFNISHCKDFSVAYIGENECGIDVEIIRRYNELMAIKICSNEEYNFLKKTKRKDYYFTALWVLKEAYLKCLGIGISAPMNKISFVHNGKLSLDMQEFNINFLNYKDGIIAVCKK